MAQKITVAILYGGLSNEREISLKTGQQVYTHLSDEKYKKHCIEMTTDGRLLMRNTFVEEGSADDNTTQTLALMDTTAGLTKNALQKFDVVFLALHGKYGEDGRVQSILDMCNVPYTGSGVLASALSMDKAMAKKCVSHLGIAVSQHMIVTADTPTSTIYTTIHNSIGYPCVIKANASGSSVGVFIIKSESEVADAIQKALQHDTHVMIEKYLSGREVTCGVLGNTHRTALDALPPVEVLSQNTFFDYDAKYFSDKTQEICPAQITQKETDTIQKYAKKIHQAFGCDGLTRSDFILKDGTFYFLEINTLPGLTEQSLCPKEAQAAGITFPEFLDKQIDLAREKNTLRK